MTFAVVPLAHPVEEPLARPAEETLSRRVPARAV
jgi:hypothetical protein